MDVGKLKRAKILRSTDMIAIHPLWMSPMGMALSTLDPTPSGYGWSIFGTHVPCSDRWWDGAWWFEGNWYLYKESVIAERWIQLDVWHGTPQFALSNVVNGLWSVIRVNRGPERYEWNSLTPNMQENVSFSNWLELSSASDNVRDTKLMGRSDSSGRQCANMEPIPYSDASQDRRRSRVGSKWIKTLLDSNSHLAKLKVFPFSSVHLHFADVLRGW